jgi:hypothetical protein
VETDASHLGQNIEGTQVEWISRTLDWAIKALVWLRAVERTGREEHVRWITEESDLNEDLEMGMMG